MAFSLKVVSPVFATLLVPVPYSSGPKATGYRPVYPGMVEEKKNKHANKTCMHMHLVDGYI